MTTHTLRKIKTHTILLCSLLVPGILWSPVVSADPLDAVADVVFGQPDFTSNIVNNGGPNATTLHRPAMVDLDFGGNLYVSDTTNHRVLIYFFPKGTDKVADIVLGQPDFFTVNQNSGGLSANSLLQPTDMILDLAGNLYVADTGNNRILIYLDPLNTNTVADVVLGQPDFTSNATNNGGVSASSFSSVHGITLDAAGNLYVADTGNNRVLIFFDPLNTDTLADVVLGQPDFTSNLPSNISSRSLNEPRGLSIDASGNLWVADLRNNRVLEYHTPLTTDTAADTVLGQPDFTSNTINNGGISASSLNLPTSVHVDDAGNIWVTDTINNRVLKFHSPLTTNTVADVVLGQPDFTSNTVNNGGVSANSLNWPQRLIVDIFGNIYVTDSENHRVLVYDGVLVPTQMLTCNGFQSPVDSPVVLKKDSKKSIPLKMILTNSEDDIITKSDIAFPPVVHVMFEGSALSEESTGNKGLLSAGKSHMGNTFRFKKRNNKWIHNLDSRHFSSPGKYIVKAVAGDSDYSIDTSAGCLQTLERLN